MDTAPVAPKPMALHLLEEITNGFSRERKLGGGTYGDVYLGKHKDGENIAVKVLKDGLDLDDVQFEKEYHNLASLHHKNVVRLVGYCHETKKECLPYNGRMVFADKTKRILCFDYMHNGSLDSFIYDEFNARNWCTRYAIIKGICEGLEYLHEKLKPPLYHLDLKPANILLDDNMSPKLADFGLSRLFLEERTKKTKNDIGTIGYVPPEYIDAGLISIKFDIFSLGVMIIKIMTGQDGYFRSAEMSSEQFVELVHVDWMNRLQATLINAYSIQIRRCIEIALSCVKANRDQRPSIGVIVNTLTKTEALIQIPDALRNDSASSINQLCPCITTDNEMVDLVGKKKISYPLRITDNRDGVHEEIIMTESTSEQLVRPTIKLCPCITTDNEMLDLLEKKMISYPLRITNNRGGVHEAIISTASTSEAVRPRIKIIRHEDGFSGASIIDAHSTEPWILVVHIDGEVSIWNAQNQTRMMAIHDIDMHGEDPKKFYVRSAKFIEPLQDFVVGDSVGYIHVYSYEKVEKLHNFRGHGKSVSSLAVHPIEPFVLSASRDKLIKLWNWETGWQCIRIFEGHSDWVHQVRFNPQTAMNTFASCSRDSTIKIWNMYSPTPVTSFDCNSRDVRALDYFILGGDLQYLVTSFSWSGSARIWDLQTNTCIKLINGLHRSGYNIAAIEGLPGRPILLTVSDDLTVAFCDSTTHRYEKRIKFNLGFIKDFAYINMTKSIAVLYEGGIAIIETVDLPQRFALDDGDSG